MFLRRRFILLMFLLCSYGCMAQNEAQEFLRNQLSYPRVQQAWSRNYDSLVALFQKKYLLFPPNDIYLRIFKAQSELELWAREDISREYRLIKTYKICAMSGVLGPKRKEGDGQVPEGCYTIEQFNPVSGYHLSLKVSYPNVADRKIIGKNVKTGGDIFIHGGCVTIGCVPITDAGIEQLYTVCIAAHANGNINIPVDIFPTRFNKAGINHLKRTYSEYPTTLKFWAEIKPFYDYFEKFHRLLPVMYSQEGKYIH
jgi:murein L,D-transpeptidase YafK